MRKIIFLVCASFYLTWDTPQAFAENRLERLRTAYPYGLLGEDYGLLTVDDLAFNTCVAKPQPISGESNFYPYWRCFKTKDVDFECDHGGEQEPGTPAQALLVLVVRQTSSKTEYLAPGIMDLRSCREYEKDWKRLTNGEKHICISGSLIRFDKDKNREYDAHWTFDKFKTRKGCISYFDGYCDTERKRQPCEGAKDK